MLEKILRQLKPNKAAKKAGMFFAAFVLTIVIMCANFTEVRGDTVETAQTNAKLQILGTSYGAGAVSAEQTAAAISALAARNISSGTELKADNTNKEPAASEDAQAKPVQIKLSATTAEYTADKTAPEETAGAVKDEQSAKFVYSDKIPLSYELQEYTFQKCSEYDLEYELVLAVMWRESRFDTGALHLNSNGTFDSGLMQINDINKKWLYDKHGIDDLMNPYQNIDAGTAILGNLSEKYGEHGAMLAYQYGEAGMVRKVNRGETTSKSVEAAYTMRDYYRELL